MCARRSLLVLRNRTAIALNLCPVPVAAVRRRVFWLVRHVRVHLSRIDLQCRRSVRLTVLDTQRHEIGIALIVAIGIDLGGANCAAFDAHGHATLGCRDIDTPANPARITASAKAFAVSTVENGSQHRLRSGALYRTKYVICATRSEEDGTRFFVMPAKPLCTARIHRLGTRAPCDSSGTAYRRGARTWSAPESSTR